MKKYFTLGLIVLFYFACEPNIKTPKVYTGEKEYRTTDPSRLYFNNIRSTSYFRKRKPNTRIDMYTLRKFSRTNKRPILYPMIVNNWMQDEAYLFIEKNDYVAYADSLIVRWEKDTMSGQFFMDVPSKKKQYHFAKNLYDCIRSKQALFIKTKTNDFVPVFKNVEDRMNFMTTMNDYYRLTEFR